MSQFSTLSLVGFIRTLKGGLAVLFFAFTLSAHALPVSVELVLDSYLKAALGKKEDQDVLAHLSNHEEKIVAAVRNEFERNGVESFLSIRNQLFDKLEQELPRASSSFLMKRLDEPLLSLYFLKVASLLEALPRSHPAYLLFIRFRAEAAANKIQLSWMRQLVYGVERGARDRGRYHHDRNEIAVALLPPQEFLVPLVHELVHRYNDHLADLKEHMSDLSQTVRELWPYYEKMGLSLRNSQDSHDRFLFARYYFLKYEYSAYLELAPVVITCRAFVDLFRQGVLSSPADKDLAFYRPVIEQEVTCFELGFKDSQARGYFPVEPFWKEGWEANWVDQYRMKWLELLQAF